MSGFTGGLCCFVFWIRLHLQLASVSVWMSGADLTVVCQLQRCDRMIRHCLLQLGFPPAALTTPLPQHAVSTNVCTLCTS